jgi:hypothetical protein
MKFTETLTTDLQNRFAGGEHLNLRNREVLKANLVALYHTIKASENLLKVAIDNSTGGLRRYFERHLDEERNHDKWLASDLETVGVKASQTVVPFVVVEMVGSVYYLIYHVSPVALLGYMFVLERLSFDLGYLAALEDIHGKDLLRTLRFHSEHDVDHADEMAQIIDSLPEDDKVLVRQVAGQTAVYIQRMIREITLRKV